MVTAFICDKISLYKGKRMNETRIKESAFAALFTVLIIIGSYIIIRIPGTPVPIVLQNMFIMLAGLLLGWRLGLISVGAYLFLGLIGLPVFSGGKGGAVHFIGPTGGYLVSYLLVVCVVAVISHMGKGRFWYKDLLALVAGGVCNYAIGLIWLKIYLKSDWLTVLTMGMVPFLPGFIFKVIVAMITVSAIRKLLPVYSDNER